MRLENRVAIVTGASGGIGRALAIELANRGCKVGMLARRRELLESLTQEIRASGCTAAWAEADVSDRAQVGDAMASLADQLGPVDLLIANAGMSVDVTLEPLNVADVERVLGVNFFGVLYVIEAVLPGMLERRSGHLAVVSSLGSIKGMPPKQAYTASKAAVDNFCEGLRMQLRGRGVGVTTIRPGFVRTPMTEKFASMPIALAPEAAARRMVRAIRREKKVYNFPLITTLLMKLRRRLPDWLLVRAARGYLQSK